MCHAAESCNLHAGTIPHSSVPHDFQQHQHAPAVQRTSCTGVQPCDPTCIASWLPRPCQAYTLWQQPANEPLTTSATPPAHPHRVEDECDCAQHLVTPATDSDEALAVTGGQLRQGLQDRTAQDKGPISRILHQTLLDVGIRHSLLLGVSSNGCRTGDSQHGTGWDGSAQGSSRQSNRSQHTQGASQ
jgi:hypothetical protein